MFKTLTSYFSPSVKKQVQPTSYAETGGTSQNQYFGEINRTRKQQENYINIYERGGLLSEAIDLYALFMFSRGFTWEGDPRAIDTCRDFMDGFDYELDFNLAVAAPLVCADGFQEILRSKGGDVLGLLYRNPTNFNIKYNNAGLVEGYEQVITNRKFFQKKIEFEENQIFHTQMFPSLREGYGTSLIQRCYDEIMRDTEISQGVTNAIKRHGTPKWWARVGQSGQPVSETVLNAITRKLEDLNSKNDIATQFDVAVSQLDTAGVGNIQAYQEYSLMRLCGAMGVPGELLGFRQGTTDNTAVSRIGAFLQKCDTLNARFARALNIQVFDQVTENPGSAKLKFNSVMPTKQADNAAWITSLIKANPLDPEAYAPVEWVKQMLGIPDTLEETYEHEHTIRPFRHFGGPGSGNFGHGGIPGQQGGSGPGGGATPSQRYQGNIARAETLRGEIEAVIIEYNSIDDDEPDYAKLNRFSDKEVELLDEYTSIEEDILAMPEEIVDRWDSDDPSPPEKTGDAEIDDHMSNMYAAYGETIEQDTDTPDEYNIRASKNQKIFDQHEKTLKVVLDRKVADLEKKLNKIGDKHGGFIN